MERMAWSDLHAVRAERHWLAGPAQLVTPSVATTAARVCGIQVQVDSTAAICVGARHPQATPDAVVLALNDDSLVRTWAMRGTLHLVPAEHSHWYAAALADSIAARETRLWPKQGVPSDAEERVNAAIIDALGDGEVSRDALARRVGETHGPDFQRLLAHPWSIGLKLAVARGLIEMRRSGRTVILKRSRPGPSRGCAEAQSWLAERFLDANVIATPATFAAWSGLSRKEAREALDAAADGTIDIDGDTYATRGRVRVPEPRGDIRLAPVFDPYTLAVPDKAAWLGGAQPALVFRRGGWVSATVLRDGTPVGVWSLTKRRTVEVKPFTRLTSADAVAVARESRRVEDLYATISSSGIASANSSP